MRVLVIGSNGQVGRCLVEQLQFDAEVELLAVDKNDVDITKQSAVSEVVESFLPSAIINAAAYTAVDLAEDSVELAYAVNCDGPMHLAVAAKKVDAVLLHISTDYVFSGKQQTPYLESDETKPTSIYGKSKLAGELAVAEACEKHITLRTAWVFGEHGNNFVKTMLKLGESHDSLSVVGDQIGGPTYAGDIAKVLILLAHKLHENEIDSGTYHYSGKPHVSWYEFAQHIFLQAKRQGVLQSVPELTEVTTEEYKTKATRPKYSKLNVDKLTNALGIDVSNWQSALNNMSRYID